MKTINDIINKRIDNQTSYIENLDLQESENIIAEQFYDCELFKKIEVINILEQMEMELKEEGISCLDYVMW